jgi:hypothetical protein
MAVAFPIPLPLPVIIAALFFSFCVIINLLH